jgi:hypothetical protein
MTRLLQAATLAGLLALGGGSIAAASVDAPAGSGDRTEVLPDPHGMAACGYWLGDGAARDLSRIRAAVRPTESQRAAFDALELAVHQAQETMRAACWAGPSDEPEELPREIDAMLLAFAIICPAFDALYAQLSDDQKSRLDDAVGRGAGDED